MKKLMALMMALVMSLSLAACGGEPANQVCVECNGVKNVTCAECNGSGKAVCPEENCDNGISGKGCKNCGGREEIIECTKCTDGREKRGCEDCDGDGIIVNPITWEAFECGNCGGSGVATYACSRCGGYELICTYCRSNSPNYPDSKYHAYYEECKTCSGDGDVACAVCKGAKEFPCSTCLPEEYQEFMANLEVQNKAEDEQALVEKAFGVLSNDDVLYVTTTETDEAKSILESYSGTYAEKEELLKELDIVETYCNTKWEYVDGNPLMIAAMSTEKPVNYEIQIGYYQGEPYVRIFSNHGDVRSSTDFDLVCDESYIFVSEDSKNHIEICETEDGNLLISKYEKETNTLMDHLELKRFAE